MPPTHQFPLIDFLPVISSALPGPLLHGLGGNTSYICPLEPYEAFADSSRALLCFSNRRPLVSGQFDSYSRELMHLGV